MKKFIIMCLCLSLILAGGPRCPSAISLSLGDALQQASKANLQVMMADARLQQAIARIAVAQSDLLPHIDGTLNAGRQTADLRYTGIMVPGLNPRVKPYNNFDARARLTIDLFDPAAFGRFESAKKGRQFSEAELAKTREDVLALVANLFLDAQRKDQTAKLTKTLLDRDQMAYDLSVEYFHQGTGTELDTKKFKADLDQMKYLYSQAQLLAKNALLDLEAALQMPLGEEIVFLDDKVLIKKMQTQASLVNFDKTSNADMDLASSQLASRNADEKTAYADFLPKVSGTANYGRSGETPGHGSNTYFVGVQASVPVWDGGAQQANLKEAQGQVKEAQENLQDVVQQQKVNVAKARMALVESEDLKESKAQQREAAQKSLLIALHAQELGTGSVFQVMQAKADLASAEDEYNEAQATWVLSHIDLFHAQGRLRELIKQGEKT